MTFMQVYQIVIPILTLGALLYTSIEDILYREVRKNIIWIIIVISGLIFDSLFIIFSIDKTEAVLEILINVVVGFILGFILFYGGIWGGADTKALWAFSILAPVHPLIAGSVIIGSEYFPVISSMVFSLLINAGLLTIFYPLVLLVVNSISASRNSLFDEVRGTPSQKIRCFLFGYKKKISKINPKKLHYMFLEQFPLKNFEGNFKGDFNGRLDGKFIGLFTGKIDGKFVGKAHGIIKKIDDDTFSKLSLEEILKTAERYSKNSNSGKILDREDFHPLLEKYRNDIFNSETNLDKESTIIVHGSLNLPLDGIFLGALDGIFDGKINGDFTGKLEGSYKGNSTQGKISGSQIPTKEDWTLKINLRLEDEEEMELTQLRIFWNLRNSSKNTVWVMPGIPFIFLMLIGYILYLLFGNIVLLLFTL